MSAAGYEWYDGRMDDDLDEVKTLLREATRILREIEVRTRTQKPPAPDGHGTKYAYEQHLKAGTEPCDECRAANAEAQRRKRERSRVRQSLG